MVENIALMETSQVLTNFGPKRARERGHLGHSHILTTTNTGLFISPSGISDPCGTVAGKVTPKWSMSTEGETLQFSVLPYRCSIC